VKFKKPVPLERINALIADFVQGCPYRVEQIGTEATLYLVHIPGKRVSELLDLFNLNKATGFSKTVADEFDFEYAEPNFIFQKDSTPNDLKFFEEWALQDQFSGGIKAESAWEISKGSSDFLVGVIDTGIYYEHPDLRNNVWSATRDFDIQVATAPAKCRIGDHGFNAINNSCNPCDLQGHGTQVSGIIGARGNNVEGIAGVNWTTSIMGLAALKVDGSGTEADIVKAIKFALEFNKLDGLPKIRVLNNSYGSKTQKDDRCRPKSLEQAIRQAGEAGILFVASAGEDPPNQNNDEMPHYPSGLGLPNIISVTGTTRSNNLGSGFNYGINSVDIGAPGASILTTDRPSGYSVRGGTSFAAPFVSGSAALILSNRRDQCDQLTPVQLKICILDNADKIPSLQHLIAEGRRLNLDRAIKNCGKYLK
jgi:subtilisin family serine protease